MVAQTRHTGQPSPKKLAFHDKLSGKGQSNDALLKKLKTLHSELAELDQELVDVSSLSNVRKELVNSSIMLHKDRGVKAYAACCMADILRLYAPDAPYTQGELRDIFQFFFKQLSNNLKGSDVTYFNQYFHLLESLSTVKSVVLVCDLPNAEELMLSIFRDMFALVRRDLPKKVETFMAEILVAIIDECSSVSGDMLEIIMAQFMDKDARIEQPAYRLAVSVCNQTADKLQRNVALYFTDIINSNTEEEDYEQIRTAHDLIKRIHSSCPGLLPSVIPQLEDELSVDSTTVRSIATQVLGEMFSSKSGADLAKNHPTTWSAWLGRKMDKSSAVRLKFVENSKGLYSALVPDMIQAIEAAFSAKLLDPDEKIRAAVCRVYSQLDYETALHHVSEAQLKAIAGRIPDKKPAVRFEAANSLAKLYSLAYTEMENNDALAISKFAWIPNELLVAALIPDCRPVVEQVFSEHVLPLPTYSPSSANGKVAEVDEVAWTDRLLHSMRYLTDKGLNSLVSLTNLKPIRPTPFEHFVDACVQNNGGVIDTDEEKVTLKLTRIIEVISVNFPDPGKAREDLKVFAKANEARLYKLLRVCLDVDTDLKGLVKANHDFFRRLEQTSSSLTSTMGALLRRGSLHLVNTSSIPTLLQRVQKGQGTTLTKTNLAANHAQLLLFNSAKYCPALFKPHIDDVMRAIEDGRNDKTVVAGLQALASVVRLDPALMPADNSSIEVIRAHAVGPDYRHSKFAARALAFCEEKEDICSALVETISESLNDASEDKLVAHLMALAQFSRFIPDAFEQKSDVITKFLLNRLLMVPSHVAEDAEDDGEEWVEDDDVSANLKAKIIALKVLRHRSLAHAPSKNALEISTPVFKMLATLLDYGGSMTGDDEQEDRKALSRIRLQAAISLLHLSTNPEYAEALAPKFVRLALTVQDTCYNVRIGFLQKLVPLLQQRKLSPKYNVIPFLTAHDPEEDVKQMASSYVAVSLKRYPADLRTHYFEFIFIRLLHLLAHHPDFATTQTELQDIAKYVLFYLELVGSAEAIPLLYFLAGKGKTVRDSESQTYSENLYAVCEMTQELIKLRANHNNWSIPTYPGKVKLPSDILRPQPNAETANKIAKQTFLPAEAPTWLAGIMSAPKEKKERKPAKRKASATNGHSKRSRKKKKQTDESDDEPGMDVDTTDYEMSDGQELAQPSDVDDVDEAPPEGRGARGKAKAKAKRQSRTSRKAGTPGSDG